MGILGFLLLLLLGGIAFWRYGSRKLFASISEAPYEIVAVKRGYEIREYAPMIVAEMECTGNIETASSEGFGALFQYVFQKTLPPVVRPLPSENIHTIAFAISEEMLRIFPNIEHPHISFRMVPQRRIAVLQFRGLISESRVQKKEQKLRAFLERDGVFSSNEVEIVLGSAPFSPPFFSQNEIAIEIV